MSQHPPLAVVNDEDQAVRLAPLEEILGNGLLHRVVHIIVEDEDGKVLLQRRGSNVATHPNSWDFSAAGYVDAGEDYDHAAERELAEELGLKDVDLKKVGKVKRSFKAGGLQSNHFSYRYKVVVPAGTPINIDEQEVGGVKWFTLEGLKDLLSQDEEVSDYFAAWLKETYFPNDNN